MPSFSVTVVILSALTAECRRPPTLLVEGKGTQVAGVLIVIAECLVCEERREWFGDKVPKHDDAIATK